MVWVKRMKKIIKVWMLTLGIVFGCCFLTGTVYAAEELLGEAVVEEPLDKETEPEVLQEDLEKADPCLQEYTLPETADKSSRSSVVSGDCGKEGSDVTWSYDTEGRNLTISGSGEMQDYGNSGNGNAPWYSYRGQIKTIQISDDITYLGEAAFYGCGSVEEVTLPSGLKQMGSAVFANCYSLNTVILNDHLEVLPDYVFQNTGITSITIGAAVQQVSSLAFFNCSLSSVTVAEENSQYTSVDGVLYSKDRKTLILYPSGRAVALFEVPSTVVTIGDYSMRNAQIQEIQIPSSVTSIGEAALMGSSLRSLTVPDSVTEIDDWAVSQCYDLEQAVLGDGVTRIGYGAFQYCSALKEIQFGSGLKELDYLAFSYCSALTEVSVPEGITEIRNGTFGECTALSKVNLPGSVKEIWYQAFLNCSSLTEITLPSELEDINRYSFYGTSISRVQIPESVVYIGDHAFPEGAELVFAGSLLQTESGSYIKGANVTVHLTETYSEAFKVLEIMNQERTQRGLSALTMDRELLDVAMKRAAELMVYFSHTRPSGEDCFSASDRMMAENIAAGYANAESAMQGWMNSAGHQANILNSSYTTVGVGVVKSEGTYYWVQCFGSEKGESVSASEKSDAARNINVLVTSGSEEYYPELYLYPESVTAGGTAQAQLYYYNGWTYTPIVPDTVTYTSSDSNKCRVSSSGTVSTLLSGKVTITAQLKDYPFITDSAELTIAERNFIFTDVNSKYWYYDTIKQVYQLGLMTGTTDTTFEPDKPMSRGMVATVLYRMAGAPNVTYQSVFSDVPGTAYYAQAVTWAYQNKIISGYGNGKFGPDDNVTREEMAVMLCNYARFRGMQVNSNQGLETFVDYKNTTAYAVPSMKWVVEKGILSGTDDGRLNPTYDASRAECAKMLLQFYKLTQQ